MTWTNFPLKSIVNVYPLIFLTTVKWLHMFWLGKVSPFRLLLNVEVTCFKSKRIYLLLFNIMIVNRFYMSQHFIKSIFDTFLVSGRLRPLSFLTGSVTDHKVIFLSVIRRTGKISESVRKGYIYSTVQSSENRCQWLWNLFFFWPYNWAQIRLIEREER